MKDKQSGKTENRPLKTTAVSECFLHQCGGVIRWQIDSHL
jgi:hypothetical protein